MVIANGSEGEPLSDKDAVLLERAPHLVLDGLQLVAHECGSEETYLYAGSQLLQFVRNALKERRTAGLTEPLVTLVASPKTFISGETSAVVGTIEGRAPIPRDRSVHSTVAGLNGRPTVVHNVETLAHIALIARYGPEWFRTRGLGDASGTTLITLSGDVTVSGVVEIPMGIPLDQLVTQYARTDTPSIRAVLVGGFHGGWIDAQDLPTTTMTTTALATVGASPGAGVIHVLGHARCGLKTSADIVEYLADQSARQCGPCINGIPRLARALSEIAYRSGSVHTQESIRYLADLVEGRGACKHPDGTVRLVRSSLHVFQHDLRMHAAGACEVNTRMGAAS
ncbi:NADH dehydrogenase [Rhodococcus sp. D-1]|nr:NADH dehydrogenase [Rhodococcus sp. D-1]